MLLFLGSGFIDTFIKYTQEFHLQEDANASKLFSSTIFATAFTIGLVVTLIRKGKGLAHLQTWIGGFIYCSACQTTISIYHHRNVVFSD